MKDTDYSFLEGKIIPYETLENVYEIEIIGVDYGIGISAVYTHNKSLHAICLNGPKSPHGFEYDMHVYDRIFKACIDMIIDGHFIMANGRAAEGKPPKNSGWGIMNPCPYGV